MYNENNMHFKNVSTMKVLGLLMQETGTFNPMYMRPYVTHITPDVLNTISDRVNNNHGEVTPSTFSGLTSGIIAPSPHSAARIPIPNGWAEKRVSFLLTLQIDTNLHGTKILYVQGYTDHLGISYNGAVDPNMHFFINSITTVSRSQVHTPSGVQNMDRVLDTSQVINGKLYNDHGYNNTGVYGLRPSDIFNSVQLSSTHYGANNGAILNDTRVRLDMGVNPARSSRKNNVPTNYMSNIISNYKRSMVLSEWSSGATDIYSRASDMAMENIHSNNEFIRQLEMATGISGCISFNIGTLEAIDPGVKFVTNYVRVGNAQMTGIHSAGQTEHWNGANRETTVATLLSNAIPSLMLEYMINKIHFKSTNHDLTGQMNTVLIDAKSVTNLDLTKSFNLFIHRLHNEIMFDITFGNQISYMLEMQCDVFGESRITISLDSGPVIMYATPSFCDSLITPVYTTNKDDLYMVAHDMEQLLGSIGTVEKQPSFNNII